MNTNDCFLTFNTQLKTGWFHIILKIRVYNSQLMYVKRNDFNKPGPFALDVLIDATANTVFVRRGRAMTDLVYLWDFELMAYIPNEL